MHELGLQKHGWAFTYYLLPPSVDVCRSDGSSMSAWPTPLTAPFLVSLVVCQYNKQNHAPVLFAHLILTTVDQPFLSKVFICLFVYVTFCLWISWFLCAPRLLSSFIDFTCHFCLLSDRTFSHRFSLILEFFAEGGFIRSNLFFPFPISA